MAASSMALKRLLSSGQLARSLLRPAQPRFFNTNAAVSSDYDSDDDRDYGDHRRSFSPFVGVFDPFTGSSSRLTRLSQLLNTMDEYADTPVATSGVRRDWEAKETADGLHLRVDMPGLGKEHVKVSVEQNMLIIKGEGEKEFEDDEAGPKYTGRVDIPEKLYKTDSIKAEMKNGVLKVFLPRIKEEERTDVFHVQVE